MVSPGVKLPKLDVPTFNGDFLNWKDFWQQFQVSVHDRSNLTNTEKLVYLQNSIKDGVAKQTIEGLTKSGEHYEEAIKCLIARYDRPRIIHQTHVRKILETPSLKEGNGKELRTLHDTVVQHLRALKSMGHEAPSSFVTSMLELKLDTTTMFEWQQYSQKQRMFLTIKNCWNLSTCEHKQRKQHSRRENRRTLHLLATILTNH